MVSRLGALSALALGLAGGCLDYASCGDWYVDLDGDGYAASRVATCAPPEGATREAPEIPDCDDDDDAAFPGDHLDGLTSDNLMSCDGVDNDCDGAIDEDEPLVTLYPDLDGDGYGPEAGAVQLGACTGGASPSLTERAGDCDDDDPRVNPDGVETVCADDVDSDCDGERDCAVSGALSAEAWASLGLTVSLGSGAGRAVQAGQDVDGDGLPDLLVGGEDAAWTVVLAGRQASATDLDLGFGSGDDAGATVALLPDLDGDGLGEVAVGGPAYQEGIATFMGRLALRPSASGGVAAITGGGTSQRIGSAVSVADGALAVGQYIRAFSAWGFYLLAPDALPGAGETAEIEDLTAFGALLAAGSAEAPPTLALAPQGGGWLLALGQPLDDATGFRVKLSDLDGGAESVRCYLRDTDEDSTLGAAVLLADLTGDGALDLVVGEPGAARVYVFTDLQGCAGTLSASDADATIEVGEISGFGGALALVPDMNGDGVDDLLVGGLDAAALLLGGADGPRLVASLAGPPGFGAAITGADVDGDGYGDLIFGADGAVTVLWGGP